MSRRSQDRRKSAGTLPRKQFPYGAVAGVGALTLGLGAILGYAVLNQGSGYIDPVEAADRRVDGVVVTSAKKLGDTGHVENPVYGKTPPVGGQMTSATAPCTVSDKPVNTGNAVHSMEHGATWVTYRPDLPKSDVKQIIDRVGGRSSVLVSPFPALDATVSAQAWGRRLVLDGPADPRLEQFVEAYAKGSHAPEGSTGC